MALSGSRLQTALRADILSKLQSAFPPGALLSGEVTAFNAAQVKLANSIADAAGPDVVTEITGNAVVSTTTSTPGAQAGASTLPGTGMGTVG